MQHKDKKAGGKMPRHMGTATVADGWQIESKAVVMEHTDEFRVKSYSFMEKKAYERRKACPYKPKPERTGSFSHSTYSLSERLYCAKCGSPMHHQWAWISPSKTYFIENLVRIGRPRTLREAQLRHLQELLNKE